jgi:Membrane-bound metallopeptidase
MEKTFHCTVCSLEQKGEYPPSPCPSCGQSRFFVDLLNHTQLEAECKRLRKQVSRLTETTVTTEENSPDTSPKPLTSIRGLGLGGQKNKKTTEESEKPPKNKDLETSLKLEINNLSQQVKSLAKEKELLQQQQKELTQEKTRLNQQLEKTNLSLITNMGTLKLQKQTLQDQIVVLEKRKALYKRLFIVFSISTIVSLLFLFI